MDRGPPLLMLAVVEGNGERTLLNSCRSGVSGGGGEAEGGGTSWPGEFSH